MNTLTKLKAMGCTSQHLDILVQDQKMQAANKINNSSMDDQVNYLLTRMSDDEIVDAIKHEFSFLRKHNMQFQSKHPEGNVKVKRKK